MRASGANLGQPMLGTRLAEASARLAVHNDTRAYLEVNRESSAFSPKRVVVTLRNVVSRQPGFLRAEVWCD
jgi:hypothetical protein